MKLINFFKRLFRRNLKEETRVIIPEESGVVVKVSDVVNRTPGWTDHMVACWLSLAISKGKLRQYKRLDQWIAKHVSTNYPIQVEELIPLSELAVTEDAKKLAQQFKLLSYHCDDVEIIKYIDKCL